MNYGSGCFTWRLKLRRCSRSSKFLLLSFVVLVTNFTATDACRNLAAQKLNEWCNNPRRYVCFKGSYSYISHFTAWLCSSAVVYDTFNFISVSFMQKPWDSWPSVFLPVPGLGAVSYLFRASCAPGTAVSSICRVPLRSMSTAFRARLPAMLETCRGGWKML